MDFAKIFRRAFKYPLNLNLFWIMLVFSLAMTLPILIYFSSFLMNEIITISELNNFLMFFIPLWLVSFFIGNFLTGFFFDSASRYFPKTKYGRFKNSFETAKKRYWSLLLTQILFFLILGFLFLIFSIFGIVIGLTAAVIASFFLFLCTVACVLDNLGPVESIKRSIELVKVNMANTLIFWIILSFIVFSVGILGSVTSITYSLLTGKFLYGMNIDNLFFMLIQIIFGTYVGLFTYSAQVNYYLSLNGKIKQRRTRKRKK